MLSQLSACMETGSAQILDSGFRILKTGLTWFFACGHTPEGASRISEFLSQPNERFPTFPHGTGIYLKAAQFNKWWSDQNVFNRSGCYPQAGLWFCILLGMLLNTWFPHPKYSSNTFWGQKLRPLGDRRHWRAKIMLYHDDYSSPEKVHFSVLTPLGDD